MSRRMIVVTGGAGFIGSNIVAGLCARTDCDVVVCDRLGEADLGKWRNIAKHPIGRLRGAGGAVRLAGASAGDAVEAVVHMGAISSTTEPDADLIIHTNFSLSRDLWRLVRRPHSGG